MSSLGSIHMKIKICGITNITDAKLVDSLGADYIGLNFYNGSPRCINVETAKALRYVIHSAKVVGLFIEQPASEIANIAKTLELDAVQIYQDIPLDLPSDVKTIYSYHQKNSGITPTLPAEQHYDYYLIDTYHPDKLGGTGKTFNWDMLPTDKSDLFVAGGVTPDNIAKLAKLNPYAADICSGVESQAGIKDPKKLHQLFKSLLSC